MDDDQTNPPDEVEDLTPEQQREKRQREYKEKQKALRREHYRKAKERYQQSEQYKLLKEKQKLLRQQAYLKAKLRRKKQKEAAEDPVTDDLAPQAELELTPMPDPPPAPKGPPKLRLIVNPDRVDD